jgi:hypothetical protein
VYQLSYNRFSRDYELSITIKEVTYLVRPPLNIQFTAKKSAGGRGLNTLSISIYNLAKTKRRALVKDAEDRTHIPIEFKAGYDGQLVRLFKGNAFTCQTIRNGVDYITTIECQDGGTDYLESFTSRAVTTKSAAINGILEDMPNTGKGKISPSLAPILRPKIIVGNSAICIDELLDDDESFYIDEEKLYIIKDNEVISTFIPVVSPQTGLKNTPKCKDEIVSFATLMNPQVKIGGQVELKSTTAVRLNAVYKIDTISYSGEYDGDDWSQECTCLLAQEFIEI